MELSFSSNAIREVALNKSRAHQVLSSELAESFFSTITDMRTARFLGELPDQPRATSRQSLNFVLYGGASLEVEPLAGCGGWDKAHRIKLMHIHRCDGSVLV